MPKIVGDDPGARMAGRRLRRHVSLCRRRNGPLEPAPWVAEGVRSSLLTRLRDPATRKDQAGDGTERRIGGICTLVVVGLQRAGV